MKHLSSRSAAVHSVLGVLVVVLGLAGAGCSDHKNLTIKGTVSYKGQPLPAGIVKLHGPGAQQLTMAYVRDGTFTITDVTPGEVKATVEPDSSQGKAVAIPKKYSDLKNSGLAFTITPSTRELDIKLE